MVPCTMQSIVFWKFRLHYSTKETSTEDAKTESAESIKVSDANKYEWIESKLLWGDWSKLQLSNNKEQLLERENLAS